MILVTGASGQLGTVFSSMLSPSQAIFCDSQTLDISNKDAIAEIIKAHQVKILINCAAYTQVDKAEQDQEKAQLVNAKALAGIGELSCNLDFRVVHFSTDYVFDGENNTPYREDDKTSPLGVYGASKLAGEKALLESSDASTVIRTSWVYASVGKNFLNTMLRVSETNPRLKVVFDQVGSPTFAGDLATAVLHILPMINRSSPRILNYSNEGVASWYDFANAIFELKGRAVEVEPIRSSEYPTRAKRPSYSVLDKTLIKKTFGIEIPHWREGLKKCLELS